VQRCKDLQTENAHLKNRNYELETEAEELLSRLQKQSQFMPAGLQLQGPVDRDLVHNMKRDAMRKSLFTGVQDDAQDELNLDLHIGKRSLKGYFAVLDRRLPLFNELR
jgi:hypothetical protein